jgi:pyruvate,orthophosphate dikinase
MKGFAMAPNVADALLAQPEDVQPLLEGLAADGLVTTSAGAFRVTDTGRTRAAELVAADRAAWGVDDAVAALDAFLELDGRMKETVTAWQLRSAEGGEPAVNDHSDPDYDASVLARLDALHRDARAWMDGLVGTWPRARRYRARLDRAAGRALAGDGRYVASPRVDSYHGVWFELHEDLIQLAGRTREQEVAAGRA